MHAYRPLVSARSLIQVLVTKNHLLKNILEFRAIYTAMRDSAVPALKTSRHLAANIAGTMLYVASAGNWEWSQQHLPSFQHLPTLITLFWQTANSLVGVPDIWVPFDMDPRMAAVATFFSQIHALGTLTVAPRQDATESAIWNTFIGLPLDLTNPSDFRFVQHIFYTPTPCGHAYLRVGTPSWLSHLRDRNSISPVYWGPDTLGYLWQAPLLFLNNGTYQQETWQMVIMSALFIMTNGTISSLPVDRAWRYFVELVPYNLRQRQRSDVPTAIVIKLPSLHDLIRRQFQVDLFSNVQNTIMATPRGMELGLSLFLYYRLLTFVLYHESGIGEIFSWLRRDPLSHLLVDLWVPVTTAHENPHAAAVHEWLFGSRTIAIENENLLDC